MRSQIKTGKWKKMNLRLDRPLFEKLTKAAEHQVRSVNGEIVARLRKSFAPESETPEVRA
jgi:hypothetical protein